MRRDRVQALLEDVATGRLPVDAALAQLDDAPVDELGFATVDTHRALRQGFPEVVFGQGKLPEQTVAIGERLAAHGDGFLVTRADAATQAALLARWPTIELNAVARTAWLPGAQAVTRVGKPAAVVTAGTSDLPVAEEAAETLRAFGHGVLRVTDVGVAGIHRILAKRETLHGAGVVIVVAGMDGALPSVVGGLVRVPVIAVPTSVGYGAAFAGLAPLLTMLNSCAAGVTVCNIDNGFGAAVAASRILAD
ncbi:nickel pincer cofactor biosynthesis protein LarB [Pseudogemmatithrix spongiicola]|uniref:Nickel pincer cofactor biosynthesis protein LarB n=1 Tax=Pseudogemmatithrix spongiicola TaxID=3062599 RepID=A0AA49K013_9BACT|nr:nickel pincer cofactor biosynthesis protein LarB [Gemmatimonadaceae bacterium 'strain 138']WKW15247.1 nickel pincer cofactor biosynthesis protein LarB [Gemmatimonadaceae bacterium 'strain 318']